MNKENLIEYKKMLSGLNESEVKDRNINYLRKIATGEIHGPMVGYASIDMPWLGYYPKEMFFERKKYNKIIDYIKDTWSDCDDDIMMHYYGNNISAREFFNTVESVARSLKSFGLEKGDAIVVDLEGTPEFVYLFFASEMIGVNVKNKIGADAMEISDVINKSNAKYLFAHDYISKEDVDIIYSSTSINNIIMINPVEHLNGDLSDLRENIREVIERNYVSELSCNNRNIKWKKFLSFDYNGNIYVESDSDTKLFSAYTSGSTGPRKEVIHSSETILEMLDQMIFPTAGDGKRDTWLWPILPPSLVAIVIAYMCMPLAQGKYCILDPYCDYKDIDLEMMHYEPNSTGLVPVFLESLIESSRISDDYDMSYLKILGFGAEPLTRKFVTRIASFLEKHNCHAPLNGGYGNSEGGSQMAIAFNNDVLMSGSTGFPLINTTLAIFDSDSEFELGYGMVGEICKAGPGIMMGYNNVESNTMAIRKHSDGRKWLHTGDLGFITKEGFLFVLGREGIRVHSNDIVYPIVIENKVSDIDGVKTAIIVSGDSRVYEGYQSPYLFIVPMDGVDVNKLILDIDNCLKDVLLTEELPEEVHFIDKKPVSHFKVDRKVLRKKYSITTNNK